MNCQYLFCCLFSNLNSIFSSSWNTFYKYFLQLCFSSFHEFVWYRWTIENRIYEATVLAAGIKRYTELNLVNMMVHQWYFLQILVINSVTNKPLRWIIIIVGIARIIHNSGFFLTDFLTSTDRLYLRNIFFQLKNSILFNSMLRHFCANL